MTGRCSCGWPNVRDDGSCRRCQVRSTKTLIARAGAIASVAIALDVVFLYLLALAVAV